jgi:hypothetical protein
MIHVGFVGRAVAAWGRRRTTRALLATAVFTAILTATACGGSGGSKPAPQQEWPTPLAAGHGRLEPGVHVLDLTARDQRGAGAAQLPRIGITIPAGWFNYDGWALGKGQIPFLVAVAFWDVARVYPTPCRWAGRPLIDPGRDVNGLASALARQPRRNAPAPADVSLAGFHGKYVELSVPNDIHFTDCDEGSFESWTASGWASDRYQQAPGQVDRLWILDVHGRRLVVDAAYLREATARDRAELDRVVRSIRFLN